MTRVCSLRATARRRAFAWLALVVLALGQGVQDLDRHPLGADDDAACWTTVAWGDASPDGVGAATDVSPNSHCPICHLQRAFGGACLAAVPVSWRADIRDARLRADATPVAFTARIPSPSRGPPLSTPR